MSARLVRELTWHRVCNIPSQDRQTSPDENERGSRMARQQGVPDVLLYVQEVYDNSNPRRWPRVIRGWRVDREEADGTLLLGSTIYTSFQEAFDRANALAINL